MFQGTISDILRPIDLEEWPAIQIKMKKNWPIYGYLYHWVGNAIRWKKQDPNFNIQLYSLSGDSSADTFIGISDFGICIVIVFTLEPNCETLKKIVQQTNYLKWSRGINFAANHIDFLPTMLSTIKAKANEKDIDIWPLTPAHYYFKSAEDSLKVEICIPSDCHLKRLDVSDVPVIHSVWPHKDLERPDLSTKYLTENIQRNGGVGLYLQINNRLVSWAIHTDWDGMGMVQTMEGYTRKGYAKVVINALAKKLGEMGISTTLFIMDNNYASLKLFEGLGFKSICPISWISLKRHKTQL